MAAVDQRVSYLRELHAGSVISVTTVVEEVHPKRLTFVHEMRNEETAEVAARTTLVGVHLDTVARKSCALPPAVIEAAQRLIAARKRGSVPLGDAR
jgi:acyl-CoA thioester hydrolase